MVNLNNLWKILQDNYEFAVFFIIFFFIFCIQQPVMAIIASCIFFTLFWMGLVTKTRSGH